MAGIREDLHRERPGAPIFERQGETLGASVILKGLPVSSSGALLIKPPIKASEDRWTGWGEDGRPRSLSIVPDSAVEKVKLEAFLGHIADKTHRMKGFVDVVGEDSMLVDCVGDQIQIRKVALAEGKAQTKREKALVIIWKASAIPEAELEELWLNMTATKAKAAV